jgi:outer membrane protein OmpA-like peptidoglycan-associated protein
MVESLNLIVESSFTMRSLHWRIEAARTGKSYGEIALLRSLLYRVEQVFLIHRKTGLLLQHVIADNTVVRDPDMVSAMLTAIQDFVHDSFGSGEDALETMRVGELSVWIQHGPEALLAGVVRGTPPQQLRTVFSSTLEGIGRDFNNEIASFDGDAAPLASAGDAMRACLIGRSPEQPRNSLLPVYIALGVVLVAFGVWLAISLRAQGRWNAYLSALQKEPGIAITHQERNGTRFTIAGLRDPLARDPAEFLRPAGISEDRVSSHWEPYLSLSSGLASRREFMQLRTAIERQIIRFEQGKSNLTSAAAGSLEAIAPQIKRLFDNESGRMLRLEIIGRTDELGNEDINARLSMDRAREAASELAAYGLDPGRFSLRSAGAGEPLRPGQTDRDRSFNRSVSFRLLAPK